MARVDNAEVLKNLNKKAQQAAAEGKVSVVVGYTQNYALYVHEMIPGRKNPPKSRAQQAAMMIAIKERDVRGHKPWMVGQPKFLEAPFRELKKTLASIIATALRNGSSLAQSLLLAGLRLQRESQLRCPVDTGALKASAFTRLET